MCHFQRLGCQLGGMFWTDTSRSRFVLHGARETTVVEVKKGEMHTREREEHRERARENVEETGKRG